jgi:hypothetical protein
MSDDKKNTNKDGYNALTPEMILEKDLNRISDIKPKVQFNSSGSIAYVSLEESAEAAYQLYLKLKELASKNLPMTNDKLHQVFWLKDLGNGNYGGYVGESPDALQVISMSAFLDAQKRIKDLERENFSSVIHKECSAEIKSLRGELDRAYKGIQKGIIYLEDAGLKDNAVMLQLMFAKAPKGGEG